MISPAPFHIDGFAGGGGASEGWEMATGIPVAIALNHDREAVAMHRMNHPMTHHECEDIRKVDPVKICKGRQPSSAWFSPDCKDFSKAKGGKPKSKRIRGLAWTVIHWINTVRPLVIYLENVEEFADWCPLLPDGTRNPLLLEWFFLCFTGAMFRRGYTHVEWAAGDGYVYRRTWEGIERIPDLQFSARACDHSDAPTIRKRLYLVARCDGRRVVWPETKPEPKRVAADCLDFHLPCPSILMTRKEATAYRRRTGIKLQRPLAKASMQRFADGTERYVMNSADPYLVFLSSAQHGGSSRSVTVPVHTIAASEKDQNQMIAVSIAKFCTGSTGSACRDPFPTITATSYIKRPGGNPPLGILASFLARTAHGEMDKHGRKRGKGFHPVTEPLGSVTGSNDLAPVAVFLAQNNGGMIGHGADEPVSTVNGKGANQSLIACALAKYYGTEQDPNLREPMHTGTTKDRFAFLTAQLEIPILTPELAKKARKVARFLRRHGVKVEGEFAMCGEFVIVDIGMRMLTPRELYRAQGFGDDYIIDRGMDIDDATGKLFEIKLTKTAQVRMCGNSVCPPMACALIRANQPEYALKEIAA